MKEIDFIRETQKRLANFMSSLWWRVFGRFTKKPKHNLYCPCCHYDGCGDFYEVGYKIIDAGKQPDTPYGYGDYWTQGIQTCLRCCHSFDLDG